MRAKIILSILFFTNAIFSQQLWKENINNLLKEIDSSGLLMGNVSISKKGEEVYQFSMGYSNVAEKIKNASETKFRVGSISKSFTAVMIMQMIEEKKLTLQAKLDDFLPEIPNADLITVEQLLRHRSGLFNITQSVDFLTWMESFHTEDEIIDLIIENGISFRPGKKTEYSNTNYILLSIILEKIEKKTYTEILKERIIIPCKLTNTYYGGDIDSKNKEAFSYFLVNDIWTPGTMTNLSVPIGAGGIVSAPSDLNSFYSQIFDGKLLNEESLLLMLDSNKLYEYALYPVISYADEVCFGHEGRIDGFHAFSAYFSKDQVSISFIANGEFGYLEDIMLQVLDYYYSSKLEEIQKTYSSEALTLELVKVNDVLLLKKGQDQPFFLDKKNKLNYVSKVNDVKLKMLKGDRIKFQSGHDKVVLNLSD
ncbi:MAG: D-alanyl-D-alanine carboxypeptidase [Flavobacteriales bacterium]|jgi:D-alanyl-D-alanine carboxypeptidase